MADDSPLPAANRLQSSAAASASLSERAARLRRLETNAVSIRASAKAMASVVRTMPLVGLYLPTEFVGQRDPSDWGIERPPLSRLIRRNGEALRAYLTMAFVLDAMSSVDARPFALVPPYSTARDRVSWTRLLYGDIDRRTAQVRLQRVLRALEGFDLVRMKRTSGGRAAYAETTLQAADGTGGIYKSVLSQNADRIKPRSRPSAFLVPAALFVRGWHRVLTEAELAAFVMLLRTRQEFVGQGSTSFFYVARELRLKGFQVSDEVYVSHRELTEFGLLRCRDNGPPRYRGRLANAADWGEPLPFRFALTAGGLAAEPVAKVTNCLRSGHPAPHLRATDQSAPARDTQWRQRRREDDENATRGS